MALPIVGYHRPRSLGEALELLENNTGLRVPLAGGTALTLSKSKREFEVIDLWGTGMNVVTRRNGSVVIQAMVTVGDLWKYAEVRSLAGGVVPQACLNLASTPLRNLITVGGNCVQLHPWSDLPPVFLALDAEFRLQTKQGSRIIPAGDFFRQNPRTVLGHDELLTEVSVPVSENFHGQFTKFRTNQVDYSLVSVATVLGLRDGAVSHARIVAGAVQPRPIRLVELEEMLTGRVLDDVLAGEVADRARAMIRPARNLRVSGEYQQDVFAAILKRHLTEAQGPRSK